jgi:hypothetical protein
MFRLFLILVFLLFGSTACSPAAPNVAGSQPTDISEMPTGEFEPQTAAGIEHEAEDGHEAESEYRQHGAHEHGAATLTIAWSGNEMEIELDSPAFNLFGFEYEPSAGDELQLVEDAIRDLESGDLFVLDGEASYRLASAQTTTAWDREGDHDDEHDDADHEEGEAHSDVRARFSLVCDAPDEIRSLDLSPLFDRFPNLDELDAQWISDTVQSAAELTGESPRLNLR